MFNAPPEEVEDVLNSVAKLDENRTWKLLATDNDGFLEKYVYQNSFVHMHILIT